MKTIIEHIGDVVSKAFEECGYDASYAKITISNRPDLCEYQCNGAISVPALRTKVSISSHRR